jgi:hypothetical protein
MVQSPIRILEQEARVGELIDVEKKWWNIPLIEDIFMKEEVEVICNMPICLGGRPDRMVWAGTKNGAFTMRSAYHLAQSMEADGEGGFMFIGETSKEF